MNTYDKVRKGVGLFTANGPLIAKSADKFSAAFQKFLGNGRFTNVVVDMDAVEQMDNHGLDCLIAALKHTSAAGGDLKIARMQECPRLFLEVIHLQTFFQIFDTVEEAFAAASRTRSALRETSEQHRHRN